MAEKRVLVKAFAERYQKATKKERGVILNEFVAASGYNRRYAAWLLRSHGKKVHLGRRWIVVGDASKKIKRNRPRLYGAEVVKSLIPVWVMLDYPCSRRLVAALPGAIEALERHGELELEADVRARLLSISPATVDRLLGEQKRRYVLKSRAKTKPERFFRHKVPVQTFAEAERSQPGHLQVDLVGHDGGQARGDFLWTVTLTDPATSWTEVETARNKSRFHVQAAFERARARLPFLVVAVHSDNGVEFMNQHFKAYCDERGIAFTRSREFKKNDNCFVEQKNGSVARRFKGYARYDTDQAWKVMQELDATVSLFVNFFLPSQKLISKKREGAKVHKRYDAPQTPLQRLLACPEISEEVKRALHEKALTLNPASLSRKINRLRRELAKLATPVASQLPHKKAVDGAGLRQAGHQAPNPTLPQPLDKAPGFAHTAHSPDEAPRSLS
ncbi:MAG: transposase [Thermoanaerobaculum sp.]|nr:MAG: transposase [Thermoanaerobaculum sp.]